MRNVKTPLLLLFFVALATGCITDPVTGKKVIGMPMSDEAEIEEGLSYAPSFTAQYEGAYPDADLQAYCGKIVLGMATASQRPTLPWTFTILNSSEVNAFALPGGTVCITRGLLYRLDDEAEFAGVMGHEIGHVTHRHSVQAMGRGALLGIVLFGAGVAAGESDSEWAQIGLTLGAVGGQLLMLSYSRGQESESDLRGVEYSRKAGYDPRELADVFRLFQSLKQESGGGGGPVWLSTHPLDQDRIDDVLADVDTRYPGAATDGTLVRTTAGWTSRIQRLRAAQLVYDDYDAAGRAYAEAVQAGDRVRMEAVVASLKDCERRLPGHAIFPSGVGVVLHQLGKTAEAEYYLKRAASMQDDLFEPHVHLAAIAFDRGDVPTTLAESDRARVLFPHHPIPYWFLARTYDGQGETAKAIENYRQVVALAPAESAEAKVATERLTALGAK